MPRVTDHTHTEKIGGDSILIFVIIQVERKTVMTAWRLRWGLLRVRPILCYMLSSIVIRMFNLSTVSIYVVIMHKFYGSCKLIIFNNVLSFTFRVMSRVGKSLFIPSHTLTCIFMT